VSDNEDPTVGLESHGLMCDPLKREILDRDPTVDPKAGVRRSIGLKSQKTGGKSMSEPPSGCMSIRPRKY
jgi:hypothetical protein